MYTVYWTCRSLASAMILRVVLLLLCPCLGYAFRPCAGNTRQKFEKHPYDCQSYFICAFQKAFPMKCGANEAWVDDEGKCKDKSSLGSVDPCGEAQHLRNRAVTPPTIEYAPEPAYFAPQGYTKPTCPHGAKYRFPHPTNCARYYDCGSNPAEDWWGKHLRECPYPLLFNASYRQCDHYARVDCGHKFVPLDPCEYIANQCRSSQCQPCIMRYGSCKGLPNGLHPWKTRENTPYFVVCKDERVVIHARCESPNPGFVFVFDSFLHTCVQPREGFHFPK